MSKTLRATHDLIEKGKKYDVLKESTDELFSACKESLKMLVRSNREDERTVRYKIRDAVSNYKSKFNPPAIITDYSRNA